MNRVAYANIGAEAGYTPKRAQGTVDKLARLFAELVDDPPWPWLERASGLVPWLADADAHKQASERGLALFGAAAGVVDVVHDKAFAVWVAREKRIDTDVVDLAVVLDGAEVTSRRIQAIAEEWPRWAWQSFTVKPRWGTSGRGRVAGVRGKAHIRAGSFDRGAVVEPWLARKADLSSLWFVDEHAEPHLLGTTLQELSGAGVYRGCDVVVTDVGLMAGTAFDERAIEGGRVVIEAAAAEGYRGACGVDSFVWQGDDGAPRLRACVELNARFTAGHVALGLVQRKAAPAGARFRFRLDDDDVLHELR